MASRKSDNKGLREKLRLRREAMARLGVAPLVCETHGGFGVIGGHLYRDLPRGVAIEKDEQKAARLARERPGWRVYEGDSTSALSRGLAGDLPINLLDADPYGDPWPTIRAFLLSERERPQRIVVAVNDGLRRGLRIGAGWRYGSLKDAVLEFGADLHPVYLQVARWMLDQEAARGGYRMEDFRGFYGGHSQGMTHYYGVLERDLALVPQIADPTSGSGRPSAARRGYGHDWQKKRAAQLRREPWCRSCRAEGRRVRATDVDHVIPRPEGTDDPSNLQSLCHACHSRKTAADPKTLPYAAARRRQGEP